MFPPSMLARKVKYPVNNDKSDGVAAEILFSFVNGLRCGLISDFRNYFANTNLHTPFLSFPVLYLLSAKFELHV